MNAGSLIDEESIMHPDLIREFELGARVAVVTGAASGIGRETAVTLAQAGAWLVLADIDLPGLIATTEMVEACGSRAIAHATDLARRADLEGLADAAQAWGGRVDAWVNAAGVLDTFTILDATEQGVDRLLRINLLGTYWACSAAGRVIRAHGGGSIVNISSAAADNPLPMLSAYAMSKAGMNMLTRTAAMEFGEFGCRVNAVAPGFVDTPMGAAAYTDGEGRIDQRLHRAFLRARAQATPLGVTGQPRDVALAVLYLVSDASRFVTGQVLRPNGGVAMA